MNATIRLLIISATIIIPWAIVRLSNLEVKARDILEYIGLSDLGVIALLIIPPITWFITKWLFGPRGKHNKKYSPGTNILIKFRG